MLRIPRFSSGPEPEAHYRAAHPAVGVAFVDTRDQLSDALGAADAAFGDFRAAPDSPLFAAIRRAPHLTWLHQASVGVDGVPLDAVPSRIALTCGKGPMATSLAEHASALMLALARQLPEAVIDQQAQRWPRGGSLGAVDRVRELAGRTVLILGVGAAGSILARICKAGFGMHVVGFVRAPRPNPYVDRYVTRDDLPAALGEADFVCLTLALTPETRRLIDATALAAMRPTAVLINVARGELVDEAALVAALQAGRLAGAGLDTVSEEPLPAEHPLWHLPNVLLTPHRAGGSDGLLPHYRAFFTENLRRFGEGQPLLGLVDRRAGY
jgi:phosphoglycerate dehydrogenase-like enzyme